MIVLVATVMIWVTTTNTGIIKTLGWSPTRGSEKLPSKAGVRLRLGGLLHIEDGLLHALNLRLTFAGEAIARARDLDRRQHLGVAGRGEIRRRGAEKTGNGCLMQKERAWRQRRKMMGRERGKLGR